jgi:hypothetical protein
VTLDSPISRDGAHKRFESDTFFPRLRSAAGDDDMRDATPLGASQGAVASPFDKASPPLGDKRLNLRGFVSPGGIA